MGLRFRKSVKIAPGVRLNLNKKSASVGVGTKGARHTVSTTGRQTTSVGIPGSGVSYVNTSNGGAGNNVSNNDVNAMRKQEKQRYIQQNTQNKQL